MRAFSATARAFGSGASECSFVLHLPFLVSSTHTPRVLASCSVFSFLFFLKFERRLGRACVCERARRVAKLPILSREAGSLLWQRAHGPVIADAALAKKLESEVQYEKQAAAEVPAEPEFVKGFLQQGVWKVRDLPSHLKGGRTCADRSRLAKRSKMCLDRTKYR